MPPSSQTPLHEGGNVFDGFPTFQWLVGLEHVKHAWPDFQCHVHPGSAGIHITINWVGKPLRTFDAMLAYIRVTTTTAGLTVKASLVENVYEKGQQASDAEMKTLDLKRHETCPNWNYTLRPRLEFVKDTWA